LPDFVTKSDFEWAIEEATKKKNTVERENSINGSKYNNKGNVNTYVKVEQSF
jgi:hypothetical protein